ncbi:hypothetical protein V1511DRAFT_512408 [Dipodascopsis uninucleata]
MATSIQLPEAKLRRGSFWTKSLSLNFSSGSTSSAESIRPPSRIYNPPPTPSSMNSLNSSQHHPNLSIASAMSTAPVASSPVSLKASSGALSCSQLYPQSPSSTSLVIPPLSSSSSSTSVRRSDSMQSLISAFKSVSLGRRAKRDSSLSMKSKASYPEISRPEYHERSSSSSALYHMSDGQTSSISLLMSRSRSRFGENYYPPNHLPDEDLGPEDTDQISKERVSFGKDGLQRRRKLASGFLRRATTDKNQSSSEKSSQSSKRKMSDSDKASKKATNVETVYHSTSTSSASARKQQSHPDPAATFSQTDIEAGQVVREYSLDSIRSSASSSVLLPSSKQNKTGKYSRHGKRPITTANAIELGNKGHKKNSSSSKNIAENPMSITDNEDNKNKNNSRDLTRQRSKVLNTGSAIDLSIPEFGGTTSSSQLFKALACDDYIDQACITKCYSTFSLVQQRKASVVSHVSRKISDTSTMSELSRDSIFDDGDCGSSDDTSLVGSMNESIRQMSAGSDEQHIRSFSRSGVCWIGADGPTDRAWDLFNGDSESDDVMDDDTISVYSSSINAGVSMSISESGSHRHYR